MVSSHQKRDLERLADRSNTPWIPIIIHGLDMTAIAPQMSLLSLWALLFQQDHLFPICAVLTYNDSRKDLHKLYRIPRNCQCKWLWDSSLAPGTSLGSSGSPGKFLFFKGRIVTTALPNLVAPRHTDDCYEIHFLHWEFCDPQLSSHQNFPLWARLYQHVFWKKPYFLSSSGYRNVGSFGKCV